MANTDIDLTPPLSEEARKYLVSRGMDWKIHDIDLAYENQQRSLKASQEDNGDETNEEDDYNDWNVAELREELNNRRAKELEGVEDDELIMQTNERLSSEGRKAELVKRLEEDDRRTT